MISWRAPPPLPYSRFPGLPAGPLSARAGLPPVHDAEAVGGDEGDKESVTSPWVMRP